MGKSKTTRRNKGAGQASERTPVDRDADRGSVAEVVPAGLTFRQLVGLPAPPPRLGNHSVRDLASVPENRPVLAKLVAYTIVMFTLPILVYFWVQEHIDLFVPSVQPAHTGIYAAVAAIITVNGIIAAYVISAFRET